MVVKVWNVKEGKITSLKHTNTKGENRLITLKEPIDYDGPTIIPDLGKAIDLMIDYVEKPFTEYDINYDYYLDKINKEIRDLEPIVTQLSLF